METDLKQTKQIYGDAYTRLIKKVKKLEKIVKSGQARRRERIVVSDDEDDLEDPSKHGRKITEIDQDPSISLVQHDVEIQGTYRHDMKFDFDFEFDAAKEVSTTGAVVTTASVVVSTISPTRNTRVSTLDDITMAEILVYIKKSAAKDKEWEDIQARVQADKELVQRLQAEEREKYTEAEQARMLAELINHRKSVNTFVPTESEVDIALHELAARSSKRVAEEELDQESSKRQKTDEISELAEEPRDKEADELS
ncbi:hypothetical protein Tco_0217259 [Tanacetum coccineum]